MLCASCRLAQGSIGDLLFLPPNSKRPTDNNGNYADEGVLNAVAPVCSLHASNVFLPTVT